MLHLLDLRQSLSPIEQKVQKRMHKSLRLNMEHCTFPHWKTVEMDVMDVFCAYVLFMQLAILNIDQVVG